MPNFQVRNQVRQRSHHAEAGSQDWNCRYSTGQFTTLCHFYRSLHGNGTQRQRPSRLRDQQCGKHSDMLSKFRRPCFCVSKPAQVMLSERVLQFNNVRLAIHRAHFSDNNSRSLTGEFSANGRICNRTAVRLPGDSRNSQSASTKADRNPGADIEDTDTNVQSRFYTTISLQ